MNNFLKEPFYIHYQIRALISFSFLENLSKNFASSSLTIDWNNHSCSPWELSIIITYHGFNIQKKNQNFAKVRGFND